MRRLVLACFALGASLASACVSPNGLIYTHTITPLTENLRDTPVVDAQGKGDTKQIDYYVRVVWNSNAIGDIAKEHGFSEVYYADLETLRVLGIWTQEWAHVYGRR